MQRSVRVALRSFGRSLIFLLLILSSSTNARPPIEFDLVTEDGFPLTGAQQWTAALRGLDLDRLRIRRGRGREQPALENRGTSLTPSYYVKGVLTARNQLRLRGGTFSLRDKVGLANWISRVSQGGIESLTAKRSAFGLTSKELVEISEKLSARVPVRTKGKSGEGVIQAIAGNLDVQTIVDPAAARVLSRSALVADELSGLSSGSALAVVLRQWGLALVPEKSQNGPVQLRIVLKDQARETWPVGWPPERKEIDVLPKLFDKLPVEINDTPLLEALGAIQSRLGVPLLMDHSGLARRQIDPEQIQVSVPAKRTYYKWILSELLRQAKLKPELRVDEAGQPFLWVSTRGR